MNFVFMYAPLFIYKYLAHKIKTGTPLQRAVHKKHDVTLTNSVHTNLLHQHLQHLHLRRRGNAYWWWWIKHGLLTCYCCTLHGESSIFIHDPGGEKGRKEMSTENTTVFWFFLFVSEWCVGSQCFYLSNLYENDPKNIIWHCSCGVVVVV